MKRRPTIGDVIAGIFTVGFYGWLAYLAIGIIVVLWQWGMRPVYR